MQARYHVAVRRPDDDAILVLRDGAMPGFALDDAPSWQVVAPVVERLRDDVGLDVVALRAAWLGEPAADGSLDRLYEVAWRGGSVPAGSGGRPLPDLERRATPLGRAIDAGVLNRPMATSSRGTARAGSTRWPPGSTRRWPMPGCDGAARSARSARGAAPRCSSSTPTVAGSGPSRSRPSSRTRSP